MDTKIDANGNIEQIKDKRIDIFYIKPDVELLTGVPRLMETAVFSILQEYARSGLFNTITFFSNLNLENILQNIPVKEYYYPEVWRKQSDDNKQASEGELDDLQQKRMTQIYNEYMRHVEMTYERMVDAGMAKEQARIVLPLSQYTLVYWTASFQSIMNFIELRDEPTAQWEIQEYAKVLKEIMFNQFPETTKLWSETYW